MGANIACPQLEMNAEGVFSACWISISWWFWTKMVFFSTFDFRGRLPFFSSD